MEKFPFSTFHCLFFWILFQKEAAKQTKPIQKTLYQLAPHHHHLDDDGKQKRRKKMNQNNLYLYTLSSLSLFKQYFTQLVSQLVEDDNDNEERKKKQILSLIDFYILGMIPTHSVIESLKDVYRLRFFFRFFAQNHYHYHFIQILCFNHKK